MKRIAIYARVSTDAQAERQTIKQQTDACETWAKTQGWAVDGHYADDGVSGTVPFEERPAAKRLLADAARGRFDAVVIYCVDRLGRDVAEGIMAHKLLQRETGAAPLFVSQSFDDTPEGRFTFNVFLSVAELERGIIARRTKQGRYRRVKDGAYLSSHVPYGYARDDGVLTVNEAEATWIRQMYAWAAQGLGLKAIATRLDEAKVETPIPCNPSGPGGRRASRWGWHHTSVHKILRHSRYVGENTYAGIKMPCPPIITKSEARAAHEALRRRQVRSARATRPENVYLLQHLLRCRECGSPFAPRTVRRADGPQVLYECRTRRVYGTKAGHKSAVWRLYDADAAPVIKRWTCELLLDPAEAARRYGVYMERPRADEVEAASLYARIDALRLEREAALDMRQRGQLTAEELDERLGKIEGEREEIEGRIDDVRAGDVELAEWLGALEWETGDLYNELLADLRAARRDIGKVLRGETYPTERWRGLLRRLIENVWVEPDGALTIESVYATACASSRQRECNHNARVRFVAALTANEKE